MRYIINVSQETLKILKRIEKESKYPQVRKRALSIQLSYEGWAIKELIKILKVSRNTIYNWFNDWEDYQLLGLYNRKGKGRNKKLLLSYQSIQCLTVHYELLMVIVSISKNV